MKRTHFITLLLLLLVMPVSIFADNYSGLWKEVENAQNKDLPETEINVLKKIISMASAERQYGNLLKAQLLKIQAINEVSPDSLIPEVKRLEQDEIAARKSDGVLAAVYQSVLGNIYKDNNELGENHAQRSMEYFKASMSNPELLAKYKAPDLEPFVIKGLDSKYFDNDLLSVIGYEAGDYATLNKYYVKSGNRQAAMFTALEMLKSNKNKSHWKNNMQSPYLRSLDSLINIYGGLKECGEVAIARYDFMANSSGNKVEDKINYIHYALGKWGEYPRMNVLRNNESVLTSSNFTVSKNAMPLREIQVINKRSNFNHIHSNVSVPKSSSIFKINNIRNVSSLTMRVSRVDVSADTNLSPSNDEDYAKLKKLSKALPEMTQTHKYYGHPNYQYFKDSMTVGALPVGVYMIEFSSEPKVEGNVKREFYYVSGIRPLMENLPDNNMRIAVVDAISGQPVPHANVKLTIEKPNANFGDGNNYDIVNLTCDGKGETIYRSTRGVDKIFVYTDSDKACIDMVPGYNQYRFNNYINKTEITDIYTDRSLYRPGQTVHAAAIVFSREDLDRQAVAGKSMKMSMYDANRKLVESKNVVTDNMGCAAADFLLPSGGLNGMFSIEANNQSSYFNVDEYKRPTFEVLFPEVNRKYQSGDTLMIKAHAKSFAGVPVQGAKVTYTVSRRAALWWSWRGNNFGNKTIKKDTVITDGDGMFLVNVPLILPEDNETAFYNFSVEAHVTDNGGETQSGSMSLSLGNRPTAFSCTLPEKIERDSLKSITFSQRNAAGKEMDVDVRYYFDNAADVKSAKTKQPTEIKENFTSGLHHLVAICGTDTIKKDVVLFSVTDTKPCVQTDFWSYQTATSFPLDNKPVSIQIGSSDENVHIFYNIISGNKVLESGTVDQSNALINRSFTYKDEYGTGLLLSYAWVKNGEYQTWITTIARPMPDKRLNLKWTTFRDRLVPGQKEEWKLNITKPDGTPVEAQLMATLYDKSLDKIRKHQWSLDLMLSQSLPSTTWHYINEGRFYVYGSSAYKPLNVKGLEYNHFDESLYPMRGFGRNIMVRGISFSSAVPPNGMRLQGRIAGLDGISNVQDSKVFYSVEEMPTMKAAKATVENGENGDGDEEGKAETNGNQVRENLNETAFFYPQLMSDKKGDVSIKFTLPESLTTWRFMGLAHTADMSNGMIGGEAVAKKVVMVQPNIPRFARVGDQTTIAAKIFNTSDKLVSGAAKMELVDPETEKVVLTREQNFSVKSGETGTANFTYIPQESPSLLICRITAAGNGFSDGEQHYLPVLPNRERVTVTVPFTQNSPGTKSIDLTKVFPAETSNEQSNRLTVEYTNNPAWLVVQALPSLGAPSEDNAISQCAAYYVQSIASSILRQSPKIKNVFKGWLMEKGNENSLQSNLQKNEELKDIVLNETPWVADAESESANKRRLAQFFDDTSLEQRLSTSIGKLSELQLPDGSWCWYKGMDGNEYLTTEIAEMLVRLNQMTGKQQRTDAMLDKAFGYMGKYIVKMVNEMKKNERKGFVQTFPSWRALHYLYLCAIDGRDLPSENRSANDYLIQLMKKEIKNQSIYDKALSAIILNKKGEAQRSKEYVKSLKEYSVMTEEMGRYYDTRRAEYSWCDYKIPTEVAAIEAIKMVTPNDTLTVQEMQRWLIQEKRTQDWDTPINSVNSVYAFMNNNTRLLDSGEKTELAVDGKKLDLPEATIGIGYVKTSLQGIHPKTFTAKKTSKGTSWGAVYAQFMQKSSDIVESASGMSVKREIIYNSPLKVGDKVTVRLTIKADRDMDFVQVIDKRAACCEPVRQLSGYRSGCYCSPKDCSTNYYFDILSKGTHVIETEYYIDRSGRYETGTCTVQCAYSPEYRATAKSENLLVK